MEQKHSALQKDLDELQEKEELASSLQDEAKIQSSLSIREALEAELEVALTEEDKRYHDASNSAAEMTRRVKEYQKAHFQEVEAHIQALRTLEYEVSGVEGNASRFHSKGYESYAMGM